MESKRHALIGIVSVAVLRCSTAGAATPSPVRWRSGDHLRPVLNSAQVVDSLTELIPQTGRRHIVVQLKGHVDATRRSALSKAGIRLLNYLGDDSFFASVTHQGVDAPGLLRLASLSGAHAIQTTWKLHPFLASGQQPTWAVVEGGSTLDPRVGVYVLFHDDVSLPRQARSTVAGHGASVRAMLPSIHGMVIEMPLSAISALAAEDNVQFIEPALPKLSALNDGNRVRVGVDLVEGAPYNLDGAGVTAMVYDVGTAKRSDGFVHPDVTGRIIFGDTSPAQPHSAHVACTLGGSGSTSPGGLLALRGMASGVTLLSYGNEDDGTNISLYSNPGDMETDYGDALNVRGADVVNNSIGTNICANAPASCAITGDYGATAALIDNIVRGSLGSPFRVVFANGNERSCTNCPVEHQNGYHSTAPPACNKNAICVGAINSNDDTMTSFSSWGPCDDGRLKPEVVAPGCRSNASTVCSGVSQVCSCNTAFGTFGYAGRCGTSMAAPTVTGLIALMLQEFRTTFPSSPDPRNSMFKALLAHHAVDLGNTGPDYQSGYGSVRIQPTIDAIAAGRFLEADIGHQQTHTTFITVNPGDTVFKVTLAWDDIAGTVPVTNALINDLDLRVFDPSGVQHFPWTLDSLNPALPAVQTQADHINNIEQVVVNAPAAGVWRVEVFGFNVIADAIIASGLQPFSLAVSPAQTVCSRAGVVTLDRAQYACEDSAVVQVVDCDLNTSNTVVDTVNVSIQSTTEALAESITLTETAADSAVFRGSIALSKTDSVGVLQVMDTDTITATYTDADDGLGGINVNVAATATASCLLATMNVTVELEGIDTTVTRDVTFVVTDCTGPQSETTTVPVSFDAFGIGQANVTTALTNASWISADENHVLRHLLPLSAPLPGTVTFTGSNRLLAGDFTNDDLVDVEDFSVLATNWGLSGTPADINGDAFQSTTDFTALAINVLKLGDPLDGCGP